MKKLLIIFILITQIVNEQEQDSLFIRKIFDEDLDKGEAYEDLRSLCKDIGNRLTGSAEAEMAVY